MPNVEVARPLPRAQRVVDDSATLRMTAPASTQQPISRPRASSASRATRRTSVETMYTAAPASRPSRLADPTAVTGEPTRTLSRTQSGPVGSVGSATKAVKKIPSSDGKKPVAGQLVGQSPAVKERAHLTASTAASRGQRSPRAEKQPGNNVFMASSVITPSKKSSPLVGATPQSTPMSTPVTRNNSRVDTKRPTQTSGHSATQIQLLKQKFNSQRQQQQQAQQQQPSSIVPQSISLLKSSSSSLSPFRLHHSNTGFRPTDLTEAEQANEISNITCTSSMESITNSFITPDFTPYPPSNTKLQQHGEGEGYEAPTTSPIFRQQPTVDLNQGSARVEVAGHGSLEADTMAQFVQIVKAIESNETSTARPNTALGTSHQSFYVSSYCVDVIYFNRNDASQSRSEPQCTDGFWGQSRGMGQRPQRDRPQL
jgi:hypothetical protein